MASNSYSLQVSKVVQETEDAVSISFDIPDALKDEFGYEAGQYIILIVEIDGKEVRRSYSFSSSPAVDEKPTIAVKKVPGGAVSPFLCEELKEGDHIKAMSPRGKFTASISPKNSHHYVLFAGGSGITPIISILRTVLAKEPHSRITLFYGNRKENGIIYKDKLALLEKIHQDRLKVIHIIEEPTVSWQRLVGRMDRIRVADLYDQYIGKFNDAHFFVCGPSPMMVEVQEALKARNVPKERLHIEYFTPPPETTAKPAQLNVGECAAQIILDGDDFELTIKKDKHLLDQLLDEGLDAPYSCMGGVCTTCRAKCLRGKTKMVDAYALNDDEIEAGYVLTCSTYVLSDEVVISYDEA